MQNKSLVFLLALALIIGLAATSCSIDPPEELVGKWYANQSDKDAGTYAYEFTSDGDIKNPNGNLLYTYKLSKTVITTYWIVRTGSINYELSSGKLILSNDKSSGLLAGTYIR